MIRSFLNKLDFLNKPIINAFLHCYYV
jgi:hypothetical protein